VDEVEGGGGGGGVVDVDVVVGAWYAAIDAGVEVDVGGGGGGVEVLVVDGAATDFGACWLSACFCATAA
jgi:hypothetical protein